MKTLFLFIAFTVLGVSLLATPKTANATFNPKATICHNGNTIEVSLSAVPAHLFHGDKLGACVVVSPSPTPTVSPTATPTSTPEATEEPCVSGDYVITKDIPDGWPTKPCDPEPTPAPTEQPTIFLTQAGAPTATPCKTIEHTPQIGWYLDKENGAELIWSPVEEPYVHTYILEYRVHGVVYNVLVEGTHYDIHADGKVESVRVSATHEACTGPWSNWTSSNVPTGVK